MSTAPAQVELRRLERAIQLDPTNAMLHWWRGVELTALNALPLAQEAFDKARSLLPRYAEAWVSIGELNASKGNRRLAKAAFRTALEIDPMTTGAATGFLATANPFERVAWRLKSAAKDNWQRMRRRRHCAGVNEALQEAKNLGSRDHVAAAMDVLRRALDCCPGHIELARVLAALLYRHGSPHHGRQLLEKMVHWWPDDAQSHYSLGVCLATTGELSAGVAALEKALALDPANHDVRVALAVATKAPPPEPAVDSIRKSFDSQAETFDRHLVEELGYQVPEKLTAIIAAADRRRERMLDLGCGTGLCGIGLRPYVDHLTGVDISQGMIEKAKERGVYDSLHLIDGIAFLRQAPTPFDLIIAADVLIYIGDLTELFHAIKLRLAPKGEFWFSVEECAGSGFEVALSKRYQHSAPYVARIAKISGLKVSYSRDVQIRLEYRKPVRGRIIALKHLHQSQRQTPNEQ